MGLRFGLEFTLRPMSALECAPLTKLRQRVLTHSEPFSLRNANRIRALLLHLH